MTIEEEHASAARELSWLLTTLPATLSSIRAALHEVNTLLQSTSTLALSTSRSESLKGIITRSGSDITRGDIRLSLNHGSNTLSLTEAISLEQLADVRDHVKLCLELSAKDIDTGSEVEDPTKNTGSGDQSIQPGQSSQQTQPSQQTQQTPQPLSRRPSSIRPSRPRGLSAPPIPPNHIPPLFTSPSSALPHLRLLHSHITSAVRSLSTQPPHRLFPFSTIASSFSPIPPIPNLAMDLYIHEAALILELRILTPHPMDGASSSSSSSAAAPASKLDSTPLSSFGSFGSRFAAAVGIAVEEVQGEDVIWEGRNMRVRERLRVEAVDASLLSCLAKLGGVGHLLGDVVRAVELVGRAAGWEV
ncbi:RAVE subunit 2/Rogdi [Pyronema omphalodes]|nr:RAVE subunit 2/Rogdi [Pyronema omphalodes]